MINKYLIQSLLTATVISTSLISPIAHANINPIKAFSHLAKENTANLPAHSNAQFQVKINRQILLATEITLSLPGEENDIVAVRTHLDRGKSGIHIWTGHIQGNQSATVIFTFKGMHVSGLIQTEDRTYRLSSNKAGKEVMIEVDLASLPTEEADGNIPEGDSDSASFSTSQDTITSDLVIQDLLVVYTEGACSYAGSCAQLEADIATAVADLNNTYVLSNVNISMNLVGTHLTDYSGTGSSSTLSALQSSTDGQMDEVHSIRDSLGADIVSMIYNGAGCGIGYLQASANTAFNVTAVPCLIGNRTMAHEIGHNQGAHHDRNAVGGGSSGAFNYGFRRCSDGTNEDKGAPYFRTVMSYSCSGAPRVGRFSNPYINYSGVPQGVDHQLSPSEGAWNAQTLNNSAIYVAGFRSLQELTIPSAPTDLTYSALSFNSATLNWLDQAINESVYVVQRRQGSNVWQSVATLSANTKQYQDLGLNPDGQYEYRVRAENSKGPSEYSNVIMITTSSLPDSIEDVATSDLPSTGNVFGTYLSTNFADNQVQSIQETSSGGPKRSRRQSYQHTWSFNVVGGAGGVMFKANAWVSGQEGAQFTYSPDGGANWQPLFIINSQNSGYQVQALLPNVSGQVLVRVTDSEQVNGEGVDTVYIDQLVITSYTSTPEAPIAPTDLSLLSSTNGQVQLQFIDLADNETGFSLRRSAQDPLGNCLAGAEVSAAPANSEADLTTIIDAHPMVGTEQYYWVLAFNAGGESSECTNAISVYVESAPSQLTVKGYKQKGTQKAELQWQGLTSDSVTIYRNQQAVTTVSNNDSAIDNIGKKGGGTYIYQVCELNNSQVCTPTQSITF